MQELRGVWKAEKFVQEERESWKSSDCIQGGSTRQEKKTELNDSNGVWHLHHRSALKIFI